MVRITKKALFGKLARHKDAILFYKRRNGTTSAIHFCEGILGLRRGEYLKYRPWIREFLRSLK
jgi:hypothetical protein